MIKVRFRDGTGQLRTVEAREGYTLMEAAKRNGVEGILAECGGACSCATCHVIVDDEWRDAVGEPGEEERELLAFADGSGPGSRLSCQVRLNARLDGLTVTVPGS